MRGASVVKVSSLLLVFACMAFGCAGTGRADSTRSNAAWRETQASLDDLLARGDCNEPLQLTRRLWRESIAEPPSPTALPVYGACELLYRAGSQCPEVSAFRAEEQARLQGRVLSLECTDTEFLAWRMLSTGEVGATSFVRVVEASRNDRELRARLRRSRAQAEIMQRDLRLVGREDLAALLGPTPAQNGMEGVETIGKLGTMVLYGLSGL